MMMKHENVVSNESMGSLRNGHGYGNGKRHKAMMHDWLNDKK